LDKLSGGLGLIKEIIPSIKILSIERSLVSHIKESEGPSILGKPDVVSPYDGNYNVGKEDLNISVLVFLNLLDHIQVFFGNIEEEYSRFILLLVGQLPKFTAELASLIGKVDSIGISSESENLGNLLLCL